MKKTKIKERDRPRIVALLRHFHAIGYTLRDRGHPLRLNRCPEDLLPLAREAGLIFPDHADASLRAQEAKP
jgi:hypothetical protein